MNLFFNCKTVNVTSLSHTLIVKGRLFINKDLFKTKYSVSMSLKKNKGKAIVYFVV